MHLFRRPTVSVVLASYNHVRFIREAVESVLNQTMQDFELLVIDDGSTDGTPEEVAKIQDKRLKLIKLTPNRRYHPRNIGIHLARGKYIAFQNSDDTWLSDKLANQINILDKQHQVVVCFTRLDIIDGQGKKINYSWAHRNLAGENRNNDAWLRLLFTTGINFGISSGVVRKNKINRLGGFCENMIQMGDYDLWIRLAGLGQFYIIDKPLTKMRIVKGKNLSRPRKDVILRSTLENLDILDRYTQWPINQYLPSIFPKIVPQDTSSANVQYAALARYAWQINTPFHNLFADRLIARLLSNPKAREEILEYFGAELVHEYIKRRGKLEIIVHETT